jgi:hypothetical protein
MMHATLDNWIRHEDLIVELRTRRPELVANSDADRYLEALQYATVARDLLKAVLDRTACSRGGPSLKQHDASTK